MPSVAFLAGLLCGLVVALPVLWLLRGPIPQPSVPAAPIAHSEELSVLSPKQQSPAPMDLRPSEPICRRETNAAANRLARLHALRSGNTRLGPDGEPLYMIASECIAFVGSEEQCARFLSERGVITLESAIEPLDLRIKQNLDLLGMRVVDSREL